MVSLWPPQVAVPYDPAGQLRWSPELLLLTPEAAHLAAPEAQIVFHHPIDLPSRRHVPQVSQQQRDLMDSPLLSIDWKSLDKSRTASFEPLDASEVADAPKWEAFAVDTFSTQIRHVGLAVFQLVFLLAASCLVSTEAPGRSMALAQTKAFAKAGVLTLGQLVGHAAIFVADVGESLPLYLLWPGCHAWLLRMRQLGRAGAQALGLDEDQLGFDMEDETRVDDDNNDDAWEEFRNLPSVEALSNPASILLLVPAFLIVFGTWLFSCALAVFPCATTLALQALSLGPLLYAAEHLGRRHRELLHSSAMGLALTGGLWIWVHRATLVTLPTIQAVAVANDENAAESWSILVTPTNFSGGGRTFAAVVGVALQALAVVLQEVIQIPLQLSPGAAASVVAVEALAVGLFVVPALSSVLSGSDFGGEFENLIDTLTMIRNRPVILLWILLFVAAAAGKSLIARTLVGRSRGLLQSLTFVAIVITAVAMQRWLPSPEQKIARPILGAFLNGGGLILCILSVLVWNSVVVLNWEEFTTKTNWPDEEEVEATEAPAFFRANLPSAVLDVHHVFVALPAGPPLSMTDIERATRDEQR